MGINRLSEVAIKAAKPRQKPCKLSDGDGLHLLVTREGGRWWRLRYRWQGREQMLSLGVYPEISLKIARDRRELRRDLYYGNYAAARHERRELRREYRDLNRDRRELYRDRY